MQLGGPDIGSAIGVVSGIAAIKPGAALRHRKTLTLLFEIELYLPDRIGVESDLAEIRTFSRDLLPLPFF